MLDLLRFAFRQLSHPQPLEPHSFRTISVHRQNSLSSAAQTPRHRYPHYYDAYAHPTDVGLQLIEGVGPLANPDGAVRARLFEVGNVPRAAKAIGMS